MGKTDHYDGLLDFTLDEKGETGRLLSALEKIAETINYQYNWKHRIVEQVVLKDVRQERWKWC